MRFQPELVLWHISAQWNADAGTKPCTVSTEPYILSTEPYILSTEHCIKFIKSTYAMFYQESCILSQTWLLLTSRVVRLCRLNISTGSILSLLPAMARVFRLEHMPNSRGNLSSLFSHTFKLSSAEHPLIWPSRC